MEIPKLVYDDFYKFIMSAGILFSIIGWGIASFLIIELNHLENTSPELNVVLELTIIIYILIAIAGVAAILYSFKKWRYNQSLLDRKLEAETEQAEINTKFSKKELETKLNKRVSEISSSERTILKTKLEKERSKIDSKNIDLMMIRYLIEEKINQILLLNNYSKTYPLVASIRLLEKTGVFDENTIHIMREVISIGNKAVHAQEIDARQHAFAMDSSEKILFILEETLKDLRGKKE